MITLIEILTFQAENKISDLHLITGEVPCMRQSNGKINALNETPLTKSDIDELVNSFLSEEEKKKMETEQGIDFARDFDNLGRFRVNIYYEIRGIGLNIRLIESDLVDIEKMEIPHQILDVVNNRSGLLLITGPNNSGKTTILNSLVDYLNTERSLKIITFEDPIEYMHKRKKSIVSQRLMGSSMEANARQLKYVFRQDANVVCVGEIRDYQTMHTVMTLCEAGYFVIATLHSIGAVQAVERIVNLYPADKRDQIFSQISSELKAVLCQTLLQYKNENKLVPCREIFIPDDAVKRKLKEGQLQSVYTHMETTAQKGNILYDQYLLGLLKSGSITQETMMKSYHDRDFIESLLE